MSLPPISPFVGAKIISNPIVVRELNYTVPFNGNIPIHYDYKVDLLITVVSNSTLNYQFDATSIKVGQWIAFSNGFSYLIIETSNLVGTQNITVTMRDIDLYCALTDSTANLDGTPFGGTPGIIFSLSEDGNPAITYSGIAGGLPSVSYWITDVVGRFEYRNYYQEYFTNVKFELLVLYNY